MRYEAGPVTAPRFPLIARTRDVAFAVDIRRAGMADHFWNLPG